jgi:hypothetical protein
MAAMPTRNPNSSDCSRNLLAAAREFVIQQLTINELDKPQLDSLINSTENRLVLNLSSTVLSYDQLRLLRLGIGFRPAYLQKLRHVEAGRAADLIVGKLGSALRTAVTESDGTTGRPLAQLTNGTTNAMMRANQQPGFYRCFSRVFRRFADDLRRMSADCLPDVDTVTGCLLSHVRKRLLVEFQNADGQLHCNLDAGQETALLQLQNMVSDRRIVIRKADKSRQICVLDPEVYDRAVLGTLSDCQSYLPTPFNLNHKCAALIKQCIRKFVDRKLLTDRQANLLLLYTDKPCIRYFYGLPKTHKPPEKWLDGIPPLRPICPDTRTETAATGCFIAQYLNPILNSIKSSLRNSYDLKDRLMKLHQLSADVVLLTSDVDSMYPSIPIGPALHRVVCKLNNKAPEFQLIVQLLRIQLAHNYFAYQDKFFQQIKGLPMGKAWAPAVASIYMEKWECSLWNVLGFEPVLYVRYLDDIFAVFNNQADANKFVQAAADHDSHIRLCDTKIGKSVHFLDLRISLSDTNRFETALYRKESDLVVLLHGRSAHSSRIKDGVINSQLRRFLRLHTNYTEAGRFMYVFMKLMVRLRGLHARRARLLWNRFISGIRAGTISIGSTSGPVLSKQLRPNRYIRRIHLAVPPTIRWKRIRSVLCDFESLLNAPQRSIMRGIHLYSKSSAPIGVALFRR